MCTCTLHFVLILIVRKVFVLKLVISCDIKIDILGQKMNLNQQQKIMHKKQQKAFVSLVIIQMKIKYFDLFKNNYLSSVNTSSIECCILYVCGWLELNFISFLIAYRYF